MSDLMQRLSARDANELEVARDANELEVARVAKLLGVNRGPAQLFAALDLTPNRLVPWEVLSDRIDYLYGEQGLTRHGISARLKRLRPALARFSARLQGLVAEGDPVPGPVEIRTHTRIGLELVTPPEWLRRRKGPDKPLPDWTIREAARAGLAVIVGLKGGSIVLAPGQKVYSHASGKVEIDWLPEAAEGEE